jgi:hypothetical protein
MIELIEKYMIGRRNLLNQLTFFILAKNKKNLQDSDASLRTTTTTRLGETVNSRFMTCHSKRVCICCTLCCVVFVVLCCAVLCSAVLLMLCYAVLYCAVLYYPLQWCVCCMPRLLNLLGESDFISLCL